MANAERTKEFSKSTPVLVKEPPLTPAALPKQIKRYTIPKIIVRSSRSL